MGISTSTLTRSLKAGSFSADVETRVERLLAAPNSGDSQQIGGQAHGDRIDRSLQILRKFMLTFPDVENAISDLLKEKRG
ncbi:hypothetical protein [Mesorhizobium sp. BHbdii]